MPGERETFNKTIFADSLSVRAALADLGTSLTRVGIPSDRIETLEIVVAEVLNNIVEHAYRDMVPGPIDIQVDAQDGALQCAVSDCGATMPGACLPQGAHPRHGSSIDDLPDGGYGWFLIRTLAQDLTYARTGGRNVLRFRIDLWHPSTKS